MMTTNIHLKAPFDGYYDHVLFIELYKACWKSIETENVFIKIEIKYEWNINFL